MFTPSVMSALFPAPSVRMDDHPEVRLKSVIAVNVPTISCLVAGNRGGRRGGSESESAACDDCGQSYFGLLVHPTLLFGVRGPNNVLPQQRVPVSPAASAINLVALPRGCDFFFRRDPLGASWVNLTAELVWGP